jgi:hypothetical protein
MLTNENVPEVIQASNVTKFVDPDAEFLEKCLQIRIFSV